MDSTTSELTAEYRAALQPVGDRLNNLVAAKTTNLVHDATHKPVANSRIGRAKKAKLTDAYDQARQRLVCAEDHLRTVLNLLTGPPLPSFALFTLIRGAAVATIHTRYLLDLAIDEPTRLGRGLSARLENLKEQHEVVAQAMPPIPIPAPFLTWEAWLDSRIANLEQRAINNGVAIGRSPKGKGRIKGFPEPWPYDTDLFEKYMPRTGKVYFKSLSGYTHSQPWTTLSMQGAVPSDEPGIAMVPTDVNVKTLAIMLDVALGLYDATIGVYLAHAGYPPMVWAEAKKG